MVGGSMRQVEFLVRDSQSSNNRCAEVAAQLIKADKVDLMTSAGSPDTVNPVSDQCEIYGTPCVSTDASWQAWFFGRRGDPAKGFDWTYHLCWGLEDVVVAFTDMWNQLPSNRIVACLYEDSAEGNVFRDEKVGLPPGFRAKNYQVFNPGKFLPNTEDYNAAIYNVKQSKADIFNTILTLPQFTVLWSQCAQQGFRPKIATIGKGLLFPASLIALGDRGRNLTTETWFHPGYPFKSGMNGQTAAQLCDAWESATNKQWTQPLGLRHAVFEVAIDVLKRTSNIDSPKSVVEAIQATNYNSIVGPVRFSGPKSPLKNVSRTPMVGGQWVQGKKYKYDLVIVSNGGQPEIPIQRKMALMSY